MLYDVSSSWLEGRCCELARFGYSRDGKKGKLQIVYGLFVRPMAAEWAVEVSKAHRRPDDAVDANRQALTALRLSRVVLVGDRGMITDARIATS